VSWDHPRSVCDGVARRHHRSPATGPTAGGADPRSATCALQGPNTHALFAAEIQYLVRENVALSAVSAVVSSSWLLRAAAFQKAPFKLTCRFESYMPSQPARSPLCFFRVCENRRHSRGLGWRAGVSSRQILRQQTQTGARASELEPRTDRGGHGGGSRLSKRDLLPALRSHLSGNLLPFA